METTVVGSRGLSRANAELVAAAMTQLGASGQPISPASLVDASRPADAPTHHLFEWDDAKAAEAHRLTWAATLIREVHVVIRRDPSDMPRQVRGFVSIVDESHGRGYLPVQAALGDSKLRQQLLSSALAELDSFKRKYETLTELAGVFSAAEEVRAQAA